MTPETADYLARARETLADAERLLGVPLPRIAAREAYLAAFHAAEAYIFERTGKIAKTHRGLRAEFARLARAEPRIASDLAGFLSGAYALKEQADYAVGAAVRPITAAKAEAAVETAGRFVATIGEVLAAD